MEIEAFIDRVPKIGEFLVSHDGHVSLVLGYIDAVTIKVLNITHCDISKKGYIINPQETTRHIIAMAEYLLTCTDTSLLEFSREFLYNKETRLNKGTCLKLDTVLFNGICIRESDVINWYNSSLNDSNDKTLQTLTSLENAETMYSADSLKAEMKRSIEEHGTVNTGNIVVGNCYRRLDRFSMWYVYFGYNEKTKEYVFGVADSETDLFKFREKLDNTENKPLWISVRKLKNIPRKLENKNALSSSLQPSDFLGFIQERVENYLSEE